MKFAYIISFFLFISCTSLKDKIFVVHKDDDIGKKFGVEDDDNKPPTPPTTPSSPVSVPVTEPTVVSDSGSEEISSQDTNKFAQRLEGIE